jgi:hypothetical protein
MTSKFKRLSPPLCGCGCGERVTLHKRKKIWNEFLKGHNAKLNPPMLNPETAKKVSNSLRALGENHPSRRPEYIESLRGENYKEETGNPPLCKCGTCGQKTKWDKKKYAYNEYMHGHSRRRKGFIERPDYLDAPFCQCNKLCKEKVNWNERKNNWNKFVSGHQNRGKFNAMKRPEHINRMKENNPMHDLDVILSVSGKNHHTYGNPMSDDWKKAISKGLRSLGALHPMKRPENRIKVTGENNAMYGKCGNESPAWKGGISNDPYCNVWLDKEYKQDIRDRDSNECQNPECRKNSFHLPLGIHHIDYDKQNCHPWNLITVCFSCNARANFKRKYWKKFYQNIMIEKYEYEREQYAS